MLPVFLFPVNKDYHYYKSMKCDVPFLLGSVSTIFTWGEHFYT